MKDVNFLMALIEKIVEEKDADLDTIFNGIREVDADIEKPAVEQALKRLVESGKLKINETYSANF